MTTHEINFAPLKWSSVCFISWQINIYNNIYKYLPAKMCFSIPGTPTSCSCSRPTLRMLWGSTTAKRTRYFSSRQYLPNQIYTYRYFMLVFLWLSFVTTFVWELFLVCTCRPENVLTYKETPRISFYIVVTNPANPSVYIPKDDVEAAIG